MGARPPPRGRGSAVRPDPALNPEGLPPRTRAQALRTAARRPTGLRRRWRVNCTGGAPIRARHTASRELGGTAPETKRGAYATGAPGARAHPRPWARIRRPAARSRRPQPSPTNVLH